MSRERRVGGGWVVLGALVAVVLLAAGMTWLTQTDRGRARVLKITLDALSPRVRGTLRIERIDGNLLAGARLYNLELRALDGEPLVIADSAYVNYGLRSLLGGDIELHELILWSGAVVVRRLPGDSLWNYEKIFQDTVPGDGGEPRAVLIRRTRLQYVDVRIQTPWEPDPALGAAAREREIADAVSDTSRIRVVEVPGGYLLTQRFAVELAELPRAAFAPVERGGNLLQIERLTADIFIWRDPARVREARATVTIRGDRLEFSIDPLRLPDSQLSASGVIMLGDTVRFNVLVQTPGAALADLQWLYPRLPEEGRIQGVLTLETRPDGTLYWLRDMQLQAPGTRLAGNFGMILNGELQFIDVDLVADPLRVSTVEAMLPAELPVRGLQIGTVEIRPAS